MYSTHNERKSVTAERFIRTLRNKIYKYMSSVSENVFIDKLDDINNKYNNTFHSTIKMKADEVKSNTYIDFNKEINNKDRKLKIVEIGRILKYIKTFFQKTLFQIGLKKFLRLKKLKILYL